MKNPEIESWEKDVAIFCGFALFVLIVALANGWVDQALETLIRGYF